MKYDQNIRPDPNENLSLRSDCARWLTGAHIEHGVRRGRCLQGRAVKRGFVRLFAAAARAGRGPFRLIGIWRHHMRMRRHLAGMDERLLDDIGLSRLDAKREINKPFWRE